MAFIKVSVCLTVPPFCSDIQVAVGAGTSPAPGGGTLLGAPFTNSLTCFLIYVPTRQFSFTICNIPFQTPFTYLYCSCQYNFILSKVFIPLPVAHSSESRHIIIVFCKSCQVILLNGRSRLNRRHFWTSFVC